MNPAFQFSSSRTLPAFVALLVALPVARAGTAQAVPRQDDLVRQELSLHAYTVQELILPDGHVDALVTTVAIDGFDVTLELFPYTVRSEDFRVLAADADRGLIAVEPPAPRTFRGSVPEIPGAGVSASLLDAGLYATIHMPDGTRWIVQPLSDAVPGAARGAHVVYHSDDVAQGDWRCGLETAQADADPGDGGAIAGTGLKIVEIGIDADFPFYQRNGSSLSATIADIELIMNNVDFVYVRDVAITYEITNIIVRTSSTSDPYTTSDPSGLLGQFASQWNTNHSDVQRDVAELFTDRDLSGSVIGIANGIGNICFSAYDLVQSRFASNLDLRTALSAHELGHNWAAVHCDGDSDCHIMCSAINGCAGVQGENLRFGTRSRNLITAHRNTRTCLTDLPDPPALPFVEPFATTTFDAQRWTHIKGAEINDLANNEPSAPFSVDLDTSFVGADNFDDDLRTNYLLLAGLSNVVLQYRTQIRAGVEPGESLIVEYRSNQNAWVEINRITADGTAQTDFQFHAHRLPARAYHDKFRVRFYTDVDERNDDFHVDDIRINNDPIFTIDIDALGAAAVPIQVSPPGLSGNADGVTPFSRDFVENTPLALTAPASHDGQPFTEWRLNGSFATSDTTLAFVVTASARAEAVYGGQPCDPCDTNCDGAVNASDIEAFIGLLFSGDAPCGEGCAGDTNGDGSVNASDIESFITCLFG